MTEQRRESRISPNFPEVFYTLADWYLCMIRGGEGGGWLSSNNNNDFIPLPTSLSFKAKPPNHPRDLLPPTSHLAHSRFPCPVLFQSTYLSIYIFQRRGVNTRTHLHNASQPLDSFPILSFSYPETFFPSLPFLERGWGLHKLMTIHSIS